MDNGNGGVSNLIMEFDDVPDFNISYKTYILYKEPKRCSYNSQGINTILKTFVKSVSIHYIAGTTKVALAIISA